MDYTYKESVLKEISLGFCHPLFKNPVFYFWQKCLDLCDVLTVHLRPNACSGDFDYNITVCNMS